MKKQTGIALLQTTATAAFDEKYEKINHEIARISAAIEQKKKDADWYHNMNWAKVGDLERVLADLTEIGDYLNGTGEYSS